jgi:hypothetical protein
LFIVIQGTVEGRPAVNAAWRAGFCPLPAASTWPSITSLIISGLTPVLSSNARITAAPSLDAGIVDRVPPKEPMGVRAAATITAFSAISSSLGLETGFVLSLR